jgi:hypothetical protein
MNFKDKDAQAARDILKEQEAKPDHVDYEFKTWKGEPFLSGTKNTTHPV